MNARRYEIVKTAGEYFSAVAGAVSFLLDILGAFFKIPALVKWILTGISGLVSALIGARNAARRMDETEAKAEQVRLNRDQSREERHEVAQLIHEMKTELDELRQELEESHHQGGSAKMKMRRIVDRLHEINHAKQNSAAIFDGLQMRPDGKKETPPSQVRMLSEEGEHKRSSNDEAFFEVSLTSPRRNAANEVVFLKPQTPTKTMNSVTQ